MMTDERPFYWNTRSLMLEREGKSSVLLTVDKHFWENLLGMLRSLTPVRKKI